MQQDGPSRAVLAGSELYIAPLWTRRQPAWRAGL